MLGIVLGSAMVFLTGKEMLGLLQKSLLGFAAGVMVAASFWSLLLPAVEMQGDMKWAVNTAVPEGAVVSIPMRATGKSRTRSFLMGCLSGIAQPLGAILVLLLAAQSVLVLLYMLAFAAGAMLYVVVEELIPEASEGEHSNLSTIGFAIGFVLMMVLDVVLG